jgi:hypothetical protein
MLHSTPPDRGQVTLEPIEFALGIVLYELASGRRPFTGERHADITHGILHDELQTQLAISSLSALQ